MKKSIGFILLFFISISSCRTPLPCEGVDCGEFAVCVIGKCECLYGRTGDFCDQFSPLQLDSLVLFLDANTMAMDWEPNQIYGWKPDVFVQFVSENFSPNDCNDAEFVLDYYYNSDIDDVPFIWTPGIRLNERNYTLYVRDNDVLKCAPRMANFDFFIDRNSPNPLIVQNSIHPDQRVELYWSWQ